MDADTSSQRKPSDEAISRQARDEIERCLLMIRKQGRALRRALSAESTRADELIAGLQEIDLQTGRINQILIDM